MEAIFHLGFQAFLYTMVVHVSGYFLIN